MQPSAAGQTSHAALFTFCLDAPVLAPSTEVGSFEAATAAAAAAAVAGAFSLPPTSHRGQNIGMDAPRSLPGASGVAAVRLLHQQSPGGGAPGTAPLPLQLSLWVAADECDAAAMHIEREPPGMWHNPSVEAPEYPLSPRAPMDHDGGSCCAAPGRNVSNECAVRALSGAVNIKSVLVVDDSPVCLKAMVSAVRCRGPHPRQLACP